LQRASSKRNISRVLERFKTKSREAKIQYLNVHQARRPARQRSSFPSEQNKTQNQIKNKNSRIEQLLSVAPEIEETLRSPQIRESIRCRIQSPRSDSGHVDVLHSSLHQLNRSSKRILCQLFQT
jgi:hypothetical protein